MNIFVFFFALSIFMSGLFCLLIGLYVLYVSRSSLRYNYFYISLALFGIGLFETLLRLSHEAYWANIWFIISHSCWILFFCTFLHFSLRFSKARINPLFVYLLGALLVPFYVLPASVFPPSYNNGFGPAYYGYDLVPGPLYPMFVIFYLIYMLGGMLIIFNTSRKSRAYYKRKQALMIVLASLIPTIAGTIFDETLVILKLPTLPLAIQTVAIITGFVGFAILRYSPIKITSLAEIAEGASEALLDAMVLIDNDNTINHVNNAACHLCGHPRETLLGKKLDFLVGKDSSGHIFLKGKRNKSLPVEVNIFGLKNKQGFIYLIRDASHLRALHEKTRSANQQMLDHIKKQKTIVNYISKLLKIDDEERLRQIWLEAQSNHMGIEPVLKPIYDFSLNFAKVFKEATQTSKELNARNESLQSINKIMRGRE
ncbi:MAG: histidine kinase N-terminal 7TM domain-containing protein, partial [Candidatus Margulisiibacteriota bacterium]